MLDGESSGFSFGSFRLFGAERRLEKDGEPVRLGARALDILIVLVERAGEVVSTRELLALVWQEVTVDEGSLRFHIKNVRRALGDSPQKPRYIASLPGRGYCFAARVERSRRPQASESAAGLPNCCTHLPARATPIFGRKDNIESISLELRRWPLITIVGAGGIGKTTLAKAIAEVLRPDFNNATVFIDLAPIESPALIVGSVASALGQVQRAETPLDALIDYLRDRRVLIILDNCEQIIEAVASLADRILHGTVSTHMLVTSREPLQLPGERVHRLMPLEYPAAKDGQSVEEALRYSAVQMFVERTTAGYGGFRFDDAMAPVAGEICRRLDGIPLAIELAAARVELLGLAGLARGLKDMFAVLTRGRRFALPRHQTLRAALDWSYQLLSPVEQAVLQSVAIFRATFVLESALAIVQGPAITLAAAVDAMGNLVAKSMLTADRAGEIVHYRLLEATRLYAHEKLESAGRKSAAARRHAEHHLRLTEDAPADWESDEGKSWLALYAGRIDDVRGALDWCFSSSAETAIGLRLMIASARLWFQLSLTLECRDRAEIALGYLSKTLDPDAVIEMRLQITLGYALWYSASAAERLEHAFHRALILAEQVGDVDVRLQALWGLWASRRARGQYRQALGFAETYESIAQLSGNLSDMLQATRILALTHHHLGRQQSARDLAENVLDVARRTGNSLNREFQLSPKIAATTMLTRILWLQGFPDQAAAMLEEAIGAAQHSNHWYSMYYVLCFAGCPLALWTGDLVKARRYLGMTVSRSAADRWRQRWAAIVLLRSSSERDALIAALLEPRVDLSTAERLLVRASADAMPVPWPEEDVGDAHWSLPEVVRVNAELLLWRDALGGDAAAESMLLHSLALAREQATLSWELRAATSLGRLWHRRGQVTKARDLVAATCDRFTEGFDTGDVAAARHLIDEWS